MRRYKWICAACGEFGKEMNKEHFWPQWLIQKTGTYKTTIRWIEGKWITAGAATLILCKRCNSDFGQELEVPVSRIFSDLEAGRGLSDNEAELLIRWLWKLEGLSWQFANPSGRYSEKYTLRERVLNPIDDIRGHLVLAISLIYEIDPEFADAPMGIDSLNFHNAIYVAGVFSKIAVMVLHEQFRDRVPENYSTYQLAGKRDERADAKIFFPEVGFKICTDAVYISVKTAPIMAYLHDKWIRGA